MARITFLPDDVTVEASAGESLAEAAARADIHLAGTCGGDGTCGKCLVFVEQGEIEGGKGPGLTAEQEEDGYVLACRSQLTGDATVQVPPASRMGRFSSADVQEGCYAPECEELEQRTHGDLEPPVRKLALAVPPPDLSDQSSDVRRIQRALAVQYGLTEVEMTPGALLKASKALRTGGWLATVLVVHDGCSMKIADIEPDDTTDRQFGIAVDIGTTTISARLVDLATGGVLGHATEYNRQATHGSDVISRIVFAGKEDGLAKLQGLVLETVRALATGLLEEAGVDGDDVVSYVVAGNTTMTHLAFGLCPASIRTEPYVPTTNVFPWCRASQTFGLPGSDEARLYAFPCPAGYVGGDITAGILATGVNQAEELTLLIDIGTNGEIVLGGSEWLMACSCSAGPAFEGGGMAHGMRASAGAIEEVHIAEGTFEPTVRTVDDAPAMGICGSGLVDAIAALLLSGAMDRRGALRHEVDSPRIRKGDRGWEYVLVWAADSGIDEDIFITEADITNLMNAKAAVHAGISVLLDSVGVEAADIARVYVAGSFGRYLDLDNVVTIGLLPDLPSERFEFVGNGSLIGAELGLVSGPSLRQATTIAEGITYLELSVDPTFMDKFVSALFLPHTDEALFPTVAARLQAGSVSQSG